MGEWGGNHNPRGINQYSGISGKTKRGTHLFKRDGSSVTLSEVGKMKGAAPAKHPEGSVQREAQKTAGLIYNAKPIETRPGGPSLPKTQARKAAAKKAAAMKPVEPTGPKQYSDAELAAMTPQQRIAARREMGQIKAKGALDQYTVNRQTGQVTIGNAHQGKITGEDGQYQFVSVFQGKGTGYASRHEALQGLHEHLSKEREKRKGGGPGGGLRNGGAAPGMIARPIGGFGRGDRSQA
jgi:hypothetical protein